jgi:hypothetical protein
MSKNLYVYKPPKSQRGENLNQNAENRQILTLESRLNSLLQRISEIERRLGNLERSAGVVKPVSNPPKTDPPNPQPRVVPSRCSYIQKTINVARREYEREHR